MPSFTEFFAQAVQKDVKNAEVTRWTDPGDYPNSLAAAPLPPGAWYLDGYEHETLTFNFGWDSLKEVPVRFNANSCFDDLCGVASGPLGWTVRWQVTEIVCTATTITVSTSIEARAPEFDPDI